MKKRLAVSLLFVFTLAVTAPAFANALPQEPQKTETKKECDKTEKKAECTAEKKADCPAEKKACCDKKAAEAKK
jgi:hypothetical protein